MTHRQREAKAARRAKRNKTGRRPHRENRSALLVAGAEAMEAIAEPRLARFKPPKPTRIAVPCTCDPPRDHGMHWVMPTADEQVALREAA